MTKNVYCRKALRRLFSVDHANCAVGKMGVAPEGRLDSKRTW